MKSKILTFLAVGLMVSACVGNQTTDSMAVETEKQSEVTHEEETRRPYRHHLHPENVG